MKTIAELVSMALLVAAPIVVTCLRPTLTIHQLQITHFLPPLGLKAALLCDMRLCLPARMGGGGKAESLPWRGPAGEAHHTGATILLWETRGQRPWRSHSIERMEA